jgi:hypothetical protein
LAVRKVQVVLQDDIDGGQPAQTVHFALDGTDYEIDLTEAHAVALRNTLEPWIAAGRRTSTARIPQPRAKSQKRDADPAEVRRWAEENGIPVASRGRISADLRSQYLASH